MAQSDIKNFANLNTTRAGISIVCFETEDNRRLKAIADRVPGFEAEWLFLDS
jgi:hypothetical protein